MKKQINNQGFSLIEFMITSSLLVIGLLAIADTSVLSSKVQVNSTSQSEITRLFDRVQNIAGAEWSCTASLSGAKYNETIAVKDPVTQEVIATEGTASKSSWSLSKVKMEDVKDVPGQPGVLRGSLVLSAAKNMKLQTGNPLMNRTIPDIYFEINPDGTIARCYTSGDTVAAAQSACQLLGGTWNADLPNKAQCQLPNGNNG